VITQFRGEYSWLSNFAPADTLLDGVIYPSVEHAFQSAKSTDLEWKKFCYHTESAGAVKKASRRVQLVDGWNSLRLEVMMTCLVQKFTHESYQYRDLLIQTGTQEIQEGNLWNDKFWGVCLKTGEGRNALGKMIMLIRSNL
jgi:ribA/ribD-fused uncharacterized protein